MYVCMYVCVCVHIPAPRANQELDKDLGAFRASYEKIVNIQTNAMQMESVPDS